MLTSLIRCSCVRIFLCFLSLFSWCTTMLGRKSSLKSLLSLLHSRPIGAAVVQQCEFLQGSQARWGLAWSFDPAERRRVEARLVREQQQARHKAAAVPTASTAPPTAAASTSAAAAAAVTAPAATPVTLRSRARIDVRRTTLSGGDLRAKLLDMVRAYAQQNALEWSTQPPAPNGFEWTVLMTPSSPASSDVTEATAPMPATPPAAPFQSIVRLLQAPPSDWMVELEWKKPAVAADRPRAQLSFTLFANALTQLCAAQLMPAAR